QRGTIILDRHTPGATPWVSDALAVDERAGRVFVAEDNGSAAHVSVLDARGRLVRHAGPVGVFPMALAVDARAEHVVIVGGARLHALKGRPQEKALPVLLADAAEWTRVACDAPEAALRLMRAFWPGALTIVLPRRPDVPDALAPLAPTSALRVPAHEPLRRVL